MNLKHYLKTYDPAILSLGCGGKCEEGHFGIDIVDRVGVDLVCDVTKGIPIPDNTFDLVVARDFLEHIPQGELCVKVMEEIYRVLKPGGEFDTLVPSTSGNNIGAFQDPYHVSFWNKIKFYYFLEDESRLSIRRLYNIQCWFKPKVLTTFDNDYDVTYVHAVLQKKD